MLHIAWICLQELVVTAPVGMGRYGKWIDPAKLMSYAVMQAQALVNGGGPTMSINPLQARHHSPKPVPA